MKPQIKKRYEELRSAFDELQSSVSLASFGDTPYSLIKRDAYRLKEAAQAVASATRREEVKNCAHDFPTPLTPYARKQSCGKCGYRRLIPVPNPSDASARQASE